MNVLKKCQLGDWINKWINLIQSNQPKGKRGKEEKNPHKSEDDSDGQEERWASVPSTAGRLDAKKTLPSFNNWWYLFGDSKYLQDFKWKLILKQSVL